MLGFPSFLGGHQLGRERCTDAIELAENAYLVVSDCLPLEVVARDHVNKGPVVLREIRECFAQRKMEEPLLPFGERCHATRELTHGHEIRVVVIDEPPANGEISIVAGGSRRKFDRFFECVASFVEIADLLIGETQIGIGVGIVGPVRDCLPISVDRMVVPVQRL